MGADGNGRPHGQECFIHASDLWLDAPLRGVVGAPPALRPALRDASLVAWRRLVEVAIARDAAFVLLAGGLFDAEGGLTARAAAALCDGVRRLRERAIAVVIGLTPPEASAAASLRWLANGAILLPPDRLTVVRLVRHGRCVATLHGASRATAAAAHLVATCQRTGPGLEIGLLPHAGDDSAAAAARTELDYWALGGSPAHMVLAPRPWMVRAGTPQGRGFAPEETGVKGCVVVDVADGRVARVAHVPLDPVRFLVLAVDVTGCADRAALRRRLLHAAEQQGAADAERACVIEAVLHGQLTPAVAGDRLTVESDLLAALRRESTRRAPRAFWVRVRDHSTRAPSADGAATGRLRRILVAQSEALNAPLPRSSFLARTFAPLLRRWEAETDLEGQRELVRDAAAVALYALETESRR